MQAPSLMGSWRSVLQRVEAAHSRSGLLVEDLACAFAHRLRLRLGSSANEQDGGGQFVFRGDAEGMMCEEIFGDGAEVGIVGAHDDGHAELRRLEGVVAAGGNQAAADKGDRRKRVDRGKFADGVEQDDAVLG